MKLRPTARCSVDEPPRRNQRRRSPPAGDCSDVSAKVPSADATFAVGWRAEESDQTSHPDGQRHQSEQPDDCVRELEEHGRCRGRDRHQHGEAKDLARRDAVRAFQRGAGHHGHGHDTVVDVGPDERRRGDAEVGPQAGRQRGRQLAGSGIAGPKGLSPRRVTRCA